jgi:hypothetical protein
MPGCDIHDDVVRKVFLVHLQCPPVVMLCLLNLSLPLVQLCVVSTIGRSINPLTFVLSTKGRLVSLGLPVLGVLVFNCATTLLLGLLGCAGLGGRVTVHDCWYWVVDRACRRLGVACLPEV